MNERKNDEAEENGNQGRRQRVFKHAFNPNIHGRGGEGDEHNVEGDHENSGTIELAYPA